MKPKIMILIVFLLAVTMFVAGCATEVDIPAEEPQAMETHEEMAEAEMEQKAEQIQEQIQAMPGEACEDWKCEPLTDSVTGDTFEISDFEGKIILMESFAVWCPTCLKQQKEMAKLRTVNGKEIVHISLDTDPNEDASQVADHATEHGFDWYFAVAPIEMTKALITEFGLSIVSAPRAPVVLICEDQSTRFLKGGLKSTEQLENEINKGC
jgi:thiol-disulfide isomerase/thioredoxin